MFGALKNLFKAGQAIRGYRNSTGDAKRGTIKAMAGWGFLAFLIVGSLFLLKYILVS